MTCARCRRCSRPAGGKGKNEDAFLPPVRLETKKRKGRPWPRAARRRRDNARCMLGSRSRWSSSSVRPPFCGYIVRTSLALDVHAFLLNREVRGVREGGR